MYYTDPLYFNGTSVIYRSCEKQTGAASTVPTTGGIAVPVVKSSSWLHHLPTPATPYDWHTSATDPYGQRSLRSDMYSATPTDTAGHMSRGVIEAPKVGKHRSACFVPLSCSSPAHHHHHYYYHQPHYRQRGGLAFG